MQNCIAPWAVNFNRGRCLLRCMGAERGGCLGRGRLERLGREHLAPEGPQRRQRHLGRLRFRGDTRRGLQVPDLSQHNGYVVDKADPFAFFSEAAPATGSRVWSLEHTWHDDDWMAKRGEKNALGAPMSIYEVHPGSWQRQDGQMIGWQELGSAFLPTRCTWASRMWN